MGAENRGLTPEHITLLQCNIRGNSRTRLAKGLPSGILSTLISPLLYFSRKLRENGRISPVSRVIAFLA